MPSAIGVMNARHYGRAAVVVLDDMEFPQRTPAVERPPRQFADVALQLGLVGGAGQARAPDVMSDVEIRILAPAQAADDGLDALA